MSGFEDAFRLLFRGSAFAGRMAVGSAKAGHRAAAQASVNAEIRASQRASYRGFVVPGDPPPAPGASGVLDYRGLATQVEIRGLERSGAIEKWPIGARLPIANRERAVDLSLPPHLLDQHAAVIGMTGTGKTYGVLIPWMHAALRGGASVVAVDVKGDLLDEMRHFSATWGSAGVRAAHWDYSAPNSSVGWSWISELTSEDAVDGAVAGILGKERPGSTQDPFFHRRDVVLLRGLLKSVIHRRGHGVPLSAVIAELNDRVTMQALATTHRGAPGTDDIVTAVAGLDQVDYSKAISGVATALARISTPDIARVSHPQVRIDDITAQPTLFVIGAPMSGGDRSEMLSSVFLNLLVAKMYARFGRSTQRVCLFLDEAPRVAGRFNFEEVLSLSRGASLSLTMALQDVAQFSSESLRSSIFANVGTIVQLAGSSATSAKLLSERMGTHLVPGGGVVRGGSQNGRSISYSNEVAPVLREREIMSPPFGDRPAIVHMKVRGVTFKPILVDLQDNH